MIQENATVSLIFFMDFPIYFDSSRPAAALFIYCICKVHRIHD